MSTYATSDEPKSGTREQKILEKAKRCFKQAVEAEASQRRREEEDLLFQVGENQWTEAAKTERGGSVGGTQVIPARPILSISLIQQPNQLVKNQAAAADLGVNIHPVSETAEKEVAEIKQGIYRRIERDSNAEQVRLFPFDRASQCGKGWYRIITKFDEDGDDPFDQEIVIKRILFQECVYMDPAAQEADFSDADWAFLVSWMPYDTFCRHYPNAKLAHLSGSEFEDFDEPEWVKVEGDRKAVLVAEYWEKEHTETTLCELADGEVVPEAEVRGRKVKRKRTRDDVTLYWYKVTGDQLLDDQECDGKYIPLVPVIGRELIPVKGERRYEGMTRPARDGQRAFNYAISNAVEDVGRLSKVPYIGAEGQFEGHEEQWKQANIRNFPYLEYKTTSIDGKPLPPPSPMQIDGSKLGLSLQLAETAKGLVQMATAVYDPSLGETPKRGQSGRAVIAQQQQSDAGTSNYLQNLANISMPYEAKVVLDLMPHIYDRPGRVTEVLGGEDEKPKTVMLNQPFVMDPSGKPVAAPEGSIPGQGGVKMYDLAKGKYAISVSIGKSYQTRLQQGQEEFGELIQNLPPELQILLLPTYMKFRDTPGAKEASELMAKYRDSKFGALTDDKGDVPSPEQLQAQIKAMEAQGQQMQQQLQMAMQAIQTKQAEQEAKIKVAEIKAQADERLAAAKAAHEEALQVLRNAGAIAVAETNAQAKGVQLANEARNEQQALGLEHAFTASQAEQARAHEQERANVDRAHEVAMAAAGGQTMTMSRDMGQETGQEQGQETSEATLPPEPAQPDGAGV